MFFSRKTPKIWKLDESDEDSSTNYTVKLMTIVM